MTKSTPPTDRKATSFSAEEIKYLDTIFKIMLRGGNPIVIPPHLVRNAAFASVAGKVERMKQKLPGEQ